MPPDPFGNLDPAFGSALQQFIAASNGLVMPGSGYRSYQEQASLYDRYRRGVAGQARAAPPGRSKHNHGLAMDLKYGPGGREWAHQNAARFGLFFPMDDEPWHVEPLGDLEGVMGSEREFGIGYNMGEAPNPQDVLANRLSAVLNIVGQNPVTGSPGTVIDDEQLLDVEAQASPYTDPTADAPSPASPLQFDGGPYPKVQGPTFGYDRAAAAPPPGQVPFGQGSKGQYQQFAAQMLPQFGMDPGEISALITLWNKESGWNPNAQNPTSTAFGIAQFLNGTWGGTGYQKTSDPYTQIRAGLQYIKGRYGSPSNALNFHLRNNWY